MESLFNRSQPVPDGDVLRPDLPETYTVGVDGYVPYEGGDRGSVTRETAPGGFNEDWEHSYEGGV